MEAGERPLDSAKRELLEETGLTARFPRLTMVEGVPSGYLGYEEHIAGSKGLHMNFVFVADVDQDAEVSPNDEFSEFRWVARNELAELSCPRNVIDFGILALRAESV
jgi:8-oxo-dGTP pyrophosphatase MutT (NUDIX family)